MDAKVRITGFGGQGVITAGYILGHAAAIADDKNSIFTQSYGPEARGSACSAQVVISDDKILYPFVKKHDILVALSQEGYDKWIDQTVEGGTVLIDEDLVEFDKLPPKIKFMTIPSTSIAEKIFDNRIVTNIIMLGFMTSITGVVSKDAMREAVQAVVPKRFAKLNSDAVEYGFEYKPEAKKKKK